MFGTIRSTSRTTLARLIPDAAPSSALFRTAGALATASLAIACGEGGPGVEGEDYALYEFGFGFQETCYVVLVEERRAAVEQAVLWNYGPNVEECDPLIPEEADRW